MDSNRTRVRAELVAGADTFGAAGATLPLQSNKKESVVKLFSSNTSTQQTRLW